VTRALRLKVERNRQGRFERGRRRMKGRGEEEEASLDNPKHPIRTMLSNRTIIESRSSRILIVNSRESSCSVYCVSASTILTMIRGTEGNIILTFPRIKATCFGRFVTYISPIRQGCSMLLISHFHHHKDIDRRTGPPPQIYSRVSP